MKILLDTHILIWALEGNKSLSNNHLQILLDKKNEKHVSLFSFMELSIKMKLGKLSISNLNIENLFQIVEQDGFNIIPILPNHIAAYEKIPLYDEHRDPFDRFLLATALIEDMTILTDDSKFHLYQQIISIV